VSFEVLYSAVKWQCKLFSATLQHATD